MVVLLEVGAVVATGPMFRSGTLVRK